VDKVRNFNPVPEFLQKDSKKQQKTPVIKTICPIFYRMLCVDLRNSNGFPKKLRQILHTLNLNHYHCYTEFIHLNLYFMKNHYYLIVLLGLLGFSSGSGMTKCYAGETVNTTTTITWPFNLGTAGQVATYTTGTEDYFSSNYVTIGSNLSTLSVNTTFGVTFTRFQPAALLGSASAEGMVGFCVKPKTGLTFTPTTVSFDCLRFGTDGGALDVIWKSTDGTLDTLATAMRPKRNNDASATPTHASYDLTAMSVPASAGEGVLQIFVYNLGSTKQIGLANVVITGLVQGTIIDVISDTITTAIDPVGAGTITSNPVGSIFDRGTEVALTATRNFGYIFSHWANANGDLVSMGNPYALTLNGNLNLTAKFNALDTYELTLAVQGGAKDYMVSAAPVGTTVETKRMYEGGTNVTITAKSNPILSFINWASGETTADLSVVMNQNQSVTAIYSAIDYIVGWDFWQSGGSGRVADFASSSENENAALVLRDSSGTTYSWLDKSQLAAGGYEGAPAAVNWKPLANKCYYQISFDATNFTDAKVKAMMLYNYNAYSVQRCEYSLNGTDFALLGTYTMTSAKVWYDSTYALPAAADHASRVYVRWIPDYTSSLVGTEALANDGTAISGIYVTATATILNDGVAPVLVSSLPANAGTGASATGKVVLTFDEKVQIAEGTTATLGSKTLTPVVSGKAITFAYTGLDFNTAYSFNLPANTVSDLGNNTLTSAVTFQFTTMNKPTVTKKTFDFIVGVDGDFSAALAAATTASSSGQRFRIFFPNGQYDIGTLTGDANQMTTISIPNVSYIGESADSVVLYNKSIQEAIGTTATMYLTSTSSGIYMQDISLMNKMDYRTGTLLGRGVALRDQGSKNIYKNVKLLSNQDTYYSGSDRTYWENGEIHGTVDFICGGGDIFFHEVLIYLEERSGNCITAPATTGDWGYVFNNCTIDGFAVNNSSYTLGRPWSNAPKAVYLNTTMKQLPTSAAWGDPMNVNPSVFAEYNSMTTGGASVDLSGRRTTYTKDATTVTLNPVLTSAQAAQYTIDNVLGSTDAWQPRLNTEQASAPVISLDNGQISWENSEYVLCWAVYINGRLTEFTTTNSYYIPIPTLIGPYSYTASIRAVNEMGGLGAMSNIVQMSSGVKQVNSGTEVVGKQYFTLDGRSLAAPVQGINIVRTRYSDGSVVVSKYAYTVKP
jgi:hypothetical protein